MAIKSKPNKAASEELLVFYRQMHVMRYLETRLTEMSQQGALRGSLHLAQGQEALPVGACAALKKDDPFTVTYRGHGYILAKGCDLKKVVAEILGRETGYCRGRGGKMHITDLEHGLLGANGIVGGGVPIAVGAAMSASIDGTDKVAMTVFGDGTMNQGVVHESLNMAGLWKLPIIFLCENNLFAEMTPLSESTVVTNLHERLSAYGIHAVRIDGNDVLLVKATVEDARARCAAGKGPVFIEAMTYRTCGHYQNDPGTAYRTKAEVAKWSADSPIDRLRRTLLETTDIKELDREEEAAKKAVDEAIEFALASPEPRAEELMEDVFA
jgi:TPP-dependent pyruvate/acetoin dehydrogenase alpha subunit